MVDAFDGNKWEKLAPGRQLPPKSPLRSLQIHETQYLKMYERASEFLFSSRLLDEKKKLERETLTFETPEAEAPAERPASAAAAGSLDQEISALLRETGEEPLEESAPSPSAEAAGTPAEADSSRPAEPDTTDQFRLQASKEVKKTAARAANAPSRVAPPKLTTDRGARIVTDVSKMIGDAKNSETLLLDLLDKLIKEGCFSKSALVVVSNDRSRAIVVAARGEDIGNGQTIDITDPLSPLAQCFSKVQSFGNRESEHSPFGSKAFAVAPIDADHETPVALYADCGNDGSLTFEARRVFRTVVELLNDKLPQIPGGIPIELDS